MEITYTNTVTGADISFASENFTFNGSFRKNQETKEIAELELEAVRTSNPNGVRQHIVLLNGTTPNYRTYDISLEDLIEIDGAIKEALVELKK